MTAERAADALQRLVDLIRELRDEVAHLPDVVLPCDGIDSRALRDQVEDIVVVVRKPFLKAHRTELYPMLGTTMNDNMVRHYTLGGELAYYLVSEGGDKAWRARCRGPSFSNIAVITEVSPGILIADLVALMGSLDIVLGEVDR